MSQKNDIIKVSIKDTNKSFIAIMTKKIGGKRVKVGEVKINPTDSEINFKNRTFPLAKELIPIYCDKGKNYFLYDIEGYEIIDSKENCLPVSVRELDALITRNIVVGFFAKLHGALEKVSVSGKIAVYIIVGVCGGTIGYIVRDQVIKIVMIPYIIKFLGVG